MSRPWKFVEVRFCTRISTKFLGYQYGYQCSIMVEPGFDAAQLRALLSANKSIGRCIEFLADCDNGDLRKSSADNRKQLEPAHIGHPEVGDYQIGESDTQFDEVGETILARSLVRTSYRKSSIAITYLEFTTTAPLLTPAGRH